MKTADKVYWLHALSSLHVGTGRGAGHIDLPLAREKVTGYPYVPGSSVKGVLADACGATSQRRTPPANGQSGGSVYNPVLHAAFGLTGDDVSNAGALVFTDARLVCLPVRSLFGTFAWCTSPAVLCRLARDLETAGYGDLPAVPAGMKTGSAHVSDHPGTALVRQGPKGATDVYLEDLDLKVVPDSQAAGWAGWIADKLFATADERAAFIARFALLADDVFNFLCETGTEVQPHVRIEEEFKRVASGALWYEESLPAESILAGLVWCDRIFGVKQGTQPVAEQDVLGLCQDHPALQIGGKASVGKGRVRCLFTATGEPKQKWGSDQ